MPVRIGVRIRGALPWDDRANRPWSPIDDLAVTEWLQSPEIGVGVGSTVAHEAVERVAYEQRFHPVLEYLEGLKWDGKERLSGWLTTYLGAPDTPYTRAVGRKFLNSAVARVMKPGVKADHMLLLEGPQSILKSTAARTIAGDEWFTDQLSDLGTKDSSQDLRGVWIVEISELAAMRPSEVERAKAYISRQVDHYRPSYGRRTVDFPRQCVFVGTTNAHEPLHDSTGGRRIWPVPCTKIDIEALKRDRDQLWAEAVAAYHAGESWWLEDDELRRAAQEEQEQRRLRDPWEDIVADWLDDPRKQPDHAGFRHPFELDRDKDGNALVAVAQILEHAIAKPVERQGTSDQMRVGKILQRLQWQKHKSHGRIVWRRGEGIPNAKVSPSGVPEKNGHDCALQTDGDTGDTCSARTHDEEQYTKCKHTEKGVQSVPGVPDVPMTKRDNGLNTYVIDDDGVWEVGEV